MKYIIKFIMVNRNDFKCEIKEIKLVYYEIE